MTQTVSPYTWNKNPIPRVEVDIADIASASVPLGSVAMPFRKLESARYRVFDFLEETIAWSADTFPATARLLRSSWIPSSYPTAPPHWAPFCGGAILTVRKGTA
jgi:hypothetical protein